jgi:hypothetical protein
MLCMLSAELVPLAQLKLSQRMKPVLSPNRPCAWFSFTKIAYNTYNAYIWEGPPMNSTVISMRLPVASGDRLKRMANRYGWTPSDASARLVEEGLRRSEFAFIDFRDSSAGRQACIQGSSLAVWEIMLLVHSYEDNLTATAKHLRWPVAKVRAAVNYTEAFPDEIGQAVAEHRAADFAALKRMLPQAVEFIAGKPAKT